VVKIQKENDMGFAGVLGSTSPKSGQGALTTDGTAKDDKTRTEATRVP
jgi:hypothetical protein